MSAIQPGKSSHKPVIEPQINTNTATTDQTQERVRSLAAAFQQASLPSSGRSLKRRKISKKTKTFSEKLLINAVKSGNTRLIKKALKSPGVNKENLLFYSVECEKHALVKLLLEKGARADSIFERNYSVLHTAATHGHLETVELLLQHGSPINVQDADGDTPLHFAVYGNHLDIVKALFANGADPESEGMDRFTPLELAEHLRHTEIIKYLKGQ